ncbi:MAG: helix-turn-helix transcriptional regulator [Actinomycetaceae bacterium]|nr:helix-turn-helix transcriptional regulator [Actinomycetaceae bacterium]MDY5273024.1 helix-turn-helix transcriptional regulator [Arcanobacterium sp.]
MKNYACEITSAVISWMAANGVTQPRLAAALGIRQSMLSKRLHGVTRWTIDDLEALDALGVGASAALVGACDE